MTLPSYKTLSPNQRFWIVFSFLLFIIAIYLVFVDFKTRSDSQILSKESSRIDQVVLSTFKESQQLRSYGEGGGLWRKISHCLVSTGTECEPYQNNYLAVPVEPGKEAEILNRIIQSIGYSRSDTIDCYFQETDICGADSVKDKFQLDIYIQPQDGTLSDKEISPRVWRQVYLHSAYR